MSRTHPLSSPYEKTIRLGDQTFHYFSLREVEKQFPDAAQLPFSLKVLLENVMRHTRGGFEDSEDIRAVAQWTKIRQAPKGEVAFRPARVLMQDFTGVPAIVDLAAMRQAIVQLGREARHINPLVPVDLVIDHSVTVEDYGSPQAFRHNVIKEYARNHERYAFLRWGQEAFDNFRVVPPGTGICHQVNLEYLGQVVWTRAQEDGKVYVYPDTLVGTDSHTPMINGLSVSGMGRGRY